MKLIKEVFKTKLSQSSIEFIILVRAVLFFSVIFFLVVQKNVEQKELEKETILAQNIALSVQNEINTASAASDGYHRDFKIDENILGKDYDIKIVGDLVAISTDNVGMAYPIPKVNGAINKGINTIKKQNGKVFLN